MLLPNQTVFHHNGKCFKIDVKTAEILRETYVVFPHVIDELFSNPLIGAGPSLELMHDIWAAVGIYQHRTELIPNITLKAFRGWMSGDVSWDSISNSPWI